MVEQSICGLCMGWTGVISKPGIHHDRFRTTPGIETIVVRLQGKQPCRLLQERSIRFFKEEIVLWLELSNKYRQTNPLVSRPITRLGIGPLSQCPSSRAPHPPC